MNYKIYLYLFPDGKAYVGMTKNSLEERRDMGYQHNKPLQRAIRKYGWHGFEHKVLVDGHPTNVNRACVSGRNYKKYFWAFAHESEVI